VQKQAARSSGAKGNRGYVAEGLEAAGGDQPDLKESFAMGRPKPPPGGEAQGGMRFEPNVWPVELPRFKAMMEIYYQEMEALSFRLLRIFARALKLPDEYFAPHFASHSSAMRLHHYPKQTTQPLPGQIRIGAHTDYGAFTILKVKKTLGARGFQVLTRREKWIEVEPENDAFLINIGDLMMTWTNDKWQSNLHRVVNPADPAENVDRYSVPFFVLPNYDALIECIPSCREPNQLPKHAPILAGDYRAKKFEELYKRAQARQAN
jgi:isopenicillin N synthase-like dioxygenase